jgi:cellulose synthase/poly-beta-1,6-N-acetylglucosamine synthase-like glycosyltransferase
MLLGAVDIIDEKGIFNIIEKIEFASLQAITAYTALIKNPIMCNGANLIVRRTKYIQYINKINKNIASGDDMFMLHAFKKNHEKIDYLYNKNYIIKTKSTNSLKNFIIQRTRWAAKSINYTDLPTIFTAILVVLINLFIISSPFLIPHFYLLIISIIFIIQNIIMLPYLFKYKQYKILKYYPILFPIMSVLYPLYIITILISIPFHNKTNPHWK